MTEEGQGTESCLLQSTFTSSWNHCDGLTLYRRQDQQTASMELTMPPCKQIKKALAMQLKRANAVR